MDGIVPRKVKGFRDIDPANNALRWQIINAAGAVYRKFGFEFWDTPTIEYADCLGKYLPDADAVAEGVYSFRNPEREPQLTPNGHPLRDGMGRVLMDHHFLTLRYDLTAPLARAYAEGLFQQSIRGNLKESKVPLFRRYQFGPAFRFEAKLDPGRYREFWQLDFDTVGTDDIAADAEACLVLSDALEAIGIPRGTYVVRVNDRKVLVGLLQSLGVGTEEGVEEVAHDILRVVDKYDKVGLAGIEAELGSGRVDEQSGAEIPGLGLDSSLVRGIVEFLEMFSTRDGRAATLERLAEAGRGNELFEEGVNELISIDSMLQGLGVDDERVMLDPTLVRGMAYYTGPVFEVESRWKYVDSTGAERRFGSICGGGRYDGLVESMLGIRVPATGASIGVDRLAELMRVSGVAAPVEAPVMLVVFGDDLMGEYQKLAFELREAGIAAEVYYGKKRGLKAQLTYADQKGSPVAVLIGEDEIAKGVVSVRNLALGSKLAGEITDKAEWRRRVQEEVPRSSVVQRIREMLNKE